MHMLIEDINGNPFVVKKNDIRRVYKMSSWGYNGMFCWN